MSFSTNRVNAPTRRLPVTSAILGFGAGVLTVAGLWWAVIGPQQTMSLYWLTTPDNSVHYVQQERSFRANNREEAIAASIRQLIAGSGNDQLISAIPPKTQLLGVKVEGEDIFLNFSPEFGSGAGSASLMGRITQVLYTATSANPKARVWLSVEGKALEVLSGDGLIIDQPLTRASFDPAQQL